MRRRSSPSFPAMKPSGRPASRTCCFATPPRRTGWPPPLFTDPASGTSPRAREKAARRLLARLLSLCPARDTVESRRAAAGPDGDPSARWLSDPDRVLARLDTFISAYGARSLLFDVWEAKPTLFDLLVLLFDRSEFLAETVDPDAGPD